MNSSYGVIQCSGQDALTFLQGQVSCDMRNITPEQGGLGAYCNLQGRVIALFYIAMVDNAYYLILPRDLIPMLLQKLQKFIVFSKATLKDVSNDWYMYTRAANVRERLNKEINIADNVFLGITTDSNLIIEYELSDHEWRKFLIEHKIPYIGLNESEKFLPHTINLIDLNAVSFKKGCFVGQEIIARMEYRGKLKKHCESLVVDGEISPNVGEIVNRIDEGGKTYLLVIV